MGSIRLNLSRDELAMLTAARGRTKRATYCQDAVVWFTVRAEDYLTNHPAQELVSLLGGLLARLRPNRDRWHRLGAGQGGASFLLAFTTEELARIDRARGTGDGGGGEAMARGSCAYIAVRCRIAYDGQLSAAPPSLVELLQLVEPPPQTD